MDNEKSRDGAVPKDAGRRALLKAATVAGGAVAASALLPGDWKKPVATIGGLPAHAQTSAEIILRNVSAALVEPGAQAANGDYFIEVKCDYEDTLGDFSGDHFIEYKITPSDASDAAALSSDCLVPIQNKLGNLSLGLSGNGHVGEMEFVTLTTCGFPRYIDFRIFLNGHTSKWTGDIEIQD